jgi:hypothetical protein
MTLLYKAFGEVGNNTLNSVNSRSRDARFCVSYGRLMETKNLASLLVEIDVLAPCAGKSRPEAFPVG